MSYLVRKITRSKWPSEDLKEMKMEDIPADAISNCMKTNKNALSTWEIPSLERLEDAILAIASGLDHIDTIDVVSIERSKMEACGLMIFENDGDTPVRELVKNHKDVISLDYRSVGEFANLILEELQENKTKRYTRAALLKIIQSAIDQGKLEKKDLKLSIQSKLPA